MFLISQRVRALTRPAHADIDVGAQGALLHVAVAGAEIAQDRAQLGHIGLGLLRVADVRFRHNLHQRHAGTVEVDIGHVRRLVVQQLGCILFQMQPFDATVAVLPPSSSTVTSPRPPPAICTG